MKKNTIPFEKIQLSVTVLTILLIVSQTIYTYSSGESFCINTGCKIVEESIKTNPLFINLMGLLFFSIYFFLILFFKKIYIHESLLKTYILIGIITEGLLLSFQIFITKTFCAYCLIIFSSVFILNMLWGFPQLFKSLLFLLCEISAFYFIGFDRAYITKYTINQGTYAIKSCEKPVKRAYLFFSKNCPHCKQVLQVLEGCTSCEIHFNPVEEITNDIFNNILKTNKYDPEINKTILGLLNIKVIPVLIAEEQEGLTFIRGDKPIIEYLSKACTHFALPDNPVNQQNNDLFNSNPFNSEVNSGICTMDKKCDEEKKSTP